jgi:hypothetical protein
MKKIAIACTAAVLLPVASPAAEQEYVTYIKPLYTTRLKDSQGGYNQMMSKMKVSFEMLNTGLRNSQISFEAQMVYPMEVAHIVESPFDEFGSLWNQIRNQDVQGIWTAYTTQGADHLSYFDSVGAGSGLAYVPGEFAFHGGVGNTVFRHEMGHNFGCSHSDGFQTSVGNTIMNGNSIPYFSNPNVTYQGVALGDATHNSAAKITANRPSSAGRRALNVDAATTSATWFMIAKHSSLAVDVQGGATTPGTPIIQWAPHYGANQQWQFNDFSGGASTFERSGSGARFVSFTTNANGTGATLQNWATGKQRYFIEEQPDGFSRVRRDDGTGVLDVPAASQTQGTQLIQYTWGGGNNQRFKPVHKVD